MYCGRLDNQVKINGYRVELGDIEHCVREVTGARQVAAIACDRGAGGIAIHVFVEGLGDSISQVLDRLRNLYFDCTLYTPEAVELLIKVVGADRVMFGSECPGTGSYVNPENGHAFDNVKPYVEGIAWLSDADKKAIFEDTARRVFKLDL